MMQNKYKIAILGATSHIAKGLIYNFSKNDNYSLSLFARSPEKAKNFINEYGLSLEKSIYTFNEFHINEYDAIISCIGIADPAKQKDAGFNLFYLTEQYDNLILDYLANNNGTTYINFSSGAVYGTSFTDPVDHGTLSTIDVNNINSKDMYRISKINSESKHRAFNGTIIDLRIFSYFSRFIDLQSKFLMTELINCIRDKTPFVTDKSDIVRDFVHPHDLFRLIEIAISIKNKNTVYDVYSAKPVKKSEILKLFKNKYNLQIDFSEEAEETSATGKKNQYYSVNHTASTIGYYPKFTSLNSIESETDLLIENNYKR
jgi:nucleoside-diphosphate-sugar epimerase